MLARQSSSSNHCNLPFGCTGNTRTDMGETGGPHAAENERFELYRFGSTGGRGISLATLRRRFDVQATAPNCDSRRWDVGAPGECWSELNRAEWVRGSWPARCLTDPNASGPSHYSDGTLILTNRRLIYAGRTPADESVLNFEELAAVRCKRHGLSLNSLMVETSSGRRFVFRTKKLACKHIEARSRMRLDQEIGRNDNPHRWALGPVDLWPRRDLPATVRVAVAAVFGTVPWSVPSFLTFWRVPEDSADERSFATNSSPQYGGSVSCGTYRDRDRSGALIGLRLARRATGPCRPPAPDPSCADDSGPWSRPACVGLRLDMGTHLHGEGAPGSEPAPLFAAHRLADLAPQDDPLPLCCRAGSGTGMEESSAAV